MNKQDDKVRQLLEHERQKAKIKIKKALSSGNYETVTIGLTTKKEQLREPSEDRTIDWASVYDSAQAYIERTAGISGCAMKKSAKDLVSLLDSLTETEND